MANAGRIRKMSHQPAVVRIGLLPGLAWLVVSGAAFAGIGAEVKPPEPKGAITISGWEYDRGSAMVYINRDIFGDYRDRHQELVVREGDKLPWHVEYDIEFPVDAAYTIQVRYASPEARPVDVWVDGNKAGQCCPRATGNAPPYCHRQPNNDRPRYEEGIHGLEWIEGCTMQVAQGKHTLKFSCQGLPPRIHSFRLDSPIPFPKEWKRTARKLDYSRMPARDRSSFLPADSVNIPALRLAIEDTMKTFGPRYPKGPQYLERLAALETRQKAADGTTASVGWREDASEELKQLHAKLSALRGDAMLSHPLLDFKALLFYRQTAADSSIYLCHNLKGNARGNICSFSLADGKVTELVPELGPGRYGRYDLSFDGTKLVFCFAKDGDRYRIYEIKLDPATGLRAPGDSLRRITLDDEVKSQSFVSYENQDTMKKGYEDIDPVYLPDGKIMFCSTRAERSVLCFPATVTTLHVMDADGKNIRCISKGQVNEISPCVLDDGRVVYMRWEYVDKGFANAQSLWSVRPDGSGNDHVYKNMLVRPAAMIHTRSIPGSRRYITIGAGHHGGHCGPVILFDSRENRSNVKGMENITPEINYPAMGPMGNNGGFFRDPYPLSEKFYLVSHKPGGRKFKNGEGIGIYVLDAWANRAELCQYPELSCYEPIPLRPRRRPTVITPVEVAEAKDAKPKPATMFLDDVYQGMPGIERGRVKYVRVMEAGNLSWEETARAGRQGDGVGQQASVVSAGGDVGIKLLHGIATVHEDGSAFFTVPPEKNVFFQALDENFMELQRMRTFLNLRPGENRSCVGCHEVRRKAPNLRDTARPLAMARGVEALYPQPGDAGPRAVHYALDVQPIWDRRCVTCHSGDKPKGDLDLTGELTTHFNRSYENLTRKALVDYLHTSGFGGSYVPAEPPLTFGSHWSKLVERIRTAPCKGELTREEFIKVVTWIDANAPFYGTHRGKKNISWRNDPEFRPLPVAMK